MIEIIKNNIEFEQNNKEIERKLLPILPERLVGLRHDALPIEQFYISHPSEDFSLRFRETLKETGELDYRATLKDRGHITDAGLERLEVEVAISPELYRYYQDEVPTIRKMRAISAGAEIDFFEDGHIQIEIESQPAQDMFTQVYGDAFIDISSQDIASNEWRAHMHYRREHGGQEAFQPPAELNTDAIVSDILCHQVTHATTFVKICGRSGSGKSTIVRQVQEGLAHSGITSEVLSTDDYHRGTNWLHGYNNGNEWIDWDAAIVYDTATMAQELSRLEAGTPIQRRMIDWTVAEPMYAGNVQPAPVIIIEGIYAGHPDFDSLDALSYTMPTPVATCIGRRLLRDMRERPQFAQLETSLAYMLGHAEPAWRAQQTS